MEVDEKKDRRARRKEERVPLRKVLYKLGNTAYKVVYVCNRIKLQILS